MTGAAALRSMVPIEPKTALFAELIESRIPQWTDMVLIFIDDIIMEICFVDSDSDVLDMLGWASELFQIKRV